MSLLPAGLGAAFAAGASSMPRMPIGAVSAGGGVSLPAPSAPLNERSMLVNPPLFWASAADGGRQDSSTTRIILMASGIKLRKFQR